MKRVAVERSRTLPPQKGRLTQRRPQTPERSQRGATRAQIPTFKTAGRTQPSPLSPALRAVAEDGNLAEEEDGYDAGNMKLQGSLWEGQIKRWNQGGVIVKAGQLRGFCPYSQLDPNRLESVLFLRGAPVDGSPLLNQSIQCVVREIDDQGRVILSEKEYWIQRALEHYSPGDLVRGKVTGIQEYGVFVTIPSEDGTDRGVYGLIHISELSWDVVTRPESIVQIGDEVEAFVKGIKRYRNQIELSLRHPRLDPLKESISSLLPLDEATFGDMSWEQPESLIPELSTILEQLEQEQEITTVQPTRQAEVQHKVSLDLELWLSKEEVEDGFNLVAWSGRTLQEIHVTTDLSRDEMKATLGKVLQRAM